MATKPADDLLGDKEPAKATTAAEDLLGDKGNGAKPPKVAKKAKKTAPAAAVKSKKATKGGWIGAKGVPTTRAEKQKAIAKPAKAKSVEKAPRGEGEKYFPADGEEYLKSYKPKLTSLKTPSTTAEIAERFELETWKVRRACVFLIKERGKGKLKAEKGSRVLTFTP